jgi:nucleoside-diphosphate-sugar epimerase
MTQLVIGYGLLGKAIVRALLAQGHDVRVLDMVACENPNVQSIVGDVRDPVTVRDVCEGVDTVYHTVALISQELGKPANMYAVNVEGTENIIHACQEQGVGQLVYTSSIDVVFDGTPIAGGDESLSYPTHHLDYYSETKMQAEQRVLAANDDGLRTVSLRVAGLYGAGDQHRFPPVMKQVVSGRFVRFGDGSARFNHLYVDNAAHAHLLAGEALRDEASPVQGQAYFITDYEATNFFDFMWDYVQALGFDPTVRRIPCAMSSTVASVTEALYQLMPRRAFANAMITHYIVAATCRDFWFIHDKATRDFGYQPIVSLEDATARTLAWLRDEYL